MMHICRVTTNREMSGILQLSGKWQGFQSKSGKYPGKNFFFRENYQKIFLKIASTGFFTLLS